MDAPSKFESCAVLCWFTTAWSSRVKRKWFSATDLVGAATGMPTLEAPKLQAPNIPTNIKALVRLPVFNAMAKIGRRCRIPMRALDLIVIFSSW
jgi:hypothetical protein